MTRVFEIEYKDRDFYIYVDMEEMKIEEIRCEDVDITDFINKGIAYELFSQIKAKISIERELKTDISKFIDNILKINDHEQSKRDIDFIHLIIHDILNGINGSNDFKGLSTVTNLINLKSNTTKKRLKSFIEFINSLFFKLEEHDNKESE